MTSLILAGLVILLTLYCLVFIFAWLCDSCREKASMEGADHEGCRRWAYVWKNLCVACIVLPVPVLIGLMIIAALGL